MPAPSTTAVTQTVANASETTAPSTTTSLSQITTSHPPVLAKPVVIAAVIKGVSPRDVIYLYPPVDEATANRYNDEVHFVIDIRYWVVMPRDRTHL